ncbi:MAG: S8 family peptidase, partial [Planctomycetes bacterium]|nr:S8 family peptidase [Planctomycetota bacterium]
PFSNKGPSAIGRAGVDVVANGAYAPGDEALNYYVVSMWDTQPNGNLSWNSWGGTSRSCPVAAGVLALAYGAANSMQTPLLGEKAKALLLSSCTDLNYDVFSQGAGSVNAGQLMRTFRNEGAFAALLHPVPEQENYIITNRWEPGGYRGEKYPAFAHVIEPGQTDSAPVGVYATYPFDETLLAVARDVELKLIDQQEFPFVVTPEMVQGEFAFGEENRDNFFKAFQYMIPLTAVPGKDPSWYNIDVPEDTDLMVVRMLYPFEQYDADGDYTYDNRYSLMVYNWTDINGNGKVWEDLNNNGTVNFINRQRGEDAPDWDLIDGGMDLAWDDPRTELDQYEFARFSYHRPGSNRLEMWVSNPLERMADGLFIGLRHTPTNRYDGPTNFRVRVEFYSEQDCPWLRLESQVASTPDLEPNEVWATLSNTLPFNSFTAHAEPPADMNPGIYQAAIKIKAPMLEEESYHTIVIPVAMTVVHPTSMVGATEWTLGGYETYTDAYNSGRLYNNACVRGQYDWTWREESGDWRFFYQDFASVSPTSEGPTEYMIVRDQWSAPAPYNDIDTVIL